MADDSIFLSQLSAIDYTTSSSGLNATSSDYYYRFIQRDSALTGREELMLEHHDFIQMMKAFGILWVGLLAFYIYDQRRSNRLILEQASSNEQVRQRLVDVESRARRLVPKRRKIEISKQIETREIRNSKEVKFLAVENMEKKSLHSAIYSSSCSLEEDVESGIVQIGENECQTTSHVQCNNSLRPQHCDGDDQTIHMSDDSETMCSICLDNFKDGDELSWARNLKCRHVFHSECLIPWLMTHDECPYCRTVLLEEIADKTTHCSNVRSENNEGIIDEEERENHLENTIFAKFSRLIKLLIPWSVDSIASANVMTSESLHY